MATSWKNRDGIGFGLVMEAGVLLQGTPVKSIAIDVGTLDWISFHFDLTRAAATSVEWWFEGSPDGTNFFRLPVVIDDGTPPGATHADGENTRAQAVTGSWGHPNVNCSSLKQMKIVVDSTAGTTDTMDVTAYGEAVSVK